jgi:hypothetical protein
LPDNIAITPGSGATAAADEIDGVLFQRLKLVHGADGVNAGDVAVGNPLPVSEIGGATSLLSRILSVLSSPMGFDRSLSRQRVTGILESGTVTTVSTVSTVTGLTNIDGRNGAMLINQTNLSAWADCVRARIT